MSWIAWVMLAIAGLVILSMIPGLQHAVKPLVGYVFDFGQFIAANIWNWTFFFIKSVWGAHVDLYRHLTNSAEDLDPSRKMEE